jgi:hypothetical protein
MCFMSSFPKYLQVKNDKGIRGWVERPRIDHDEEQPAEQGGEMNRNNPRRNNNFFNFGLMTCFSFDDHLRVFIFLFASLSPQESVQLHPHFLRLGTANNQTTSPFVSHRTQAGVVVWFHARVISRASKEGYPAQEK